MPLIVRYHLTLLLLSATLAMAQLPMPNTPTNYTEKMLETIRKNAADYESDDPETRRRAILVLSKYKEHAQVKMVLQAALSDTVARIRQAALVTLVAGIPDRRTALKVCGLLTDPSVSVRRICSAALPRLLLSIRVYGDATEMGPSIRNTLPEEVIKIIKKAHADKDATVRKNLVAIWSQVPQAVDAATVARFLQDSNRDVRITAMDKGRFVIPTKDFLKVAVGRVDDSDRQVRLQLAQILGLYVAYGQLDALDTLSKDKDPEVRARAFMGLMSAGRKEAWESLKKEIAAKRVKSSVAMGALERLPRLGDDGIKELKGFLTSKDAGFRAAALNTMGRYQPQSISDQALMAALKDPSAEVRTMAGRILQQRPKLGAASLKVLAASPHKDVREMGLGFVGLAPRNIAQSILMDLFLDESTTIRQGALRRIGRLRLKGWRQLMTDALEDEEKSIREQAVSSLVEGVPYRPQANDPNLKPLIDYLKQGKDDALKAFIRSNLALRLPSSP